MKKLIIIIGLVGAFHSQAQYSYDATKLMNDVKFLSSNDMEGRKTGTTGIKKAEEFIIQQLKNSKVESFIYGYVQSFPINGSTVTGRNIVGVIPGKKKETIVLSAHYDHLGIKNQEIYNGADDDASGVAALLAMIQYFKKNQPEHRIIFAFFDAEEMGLLGSAYFTNHLDLQKENIVLNVNLDMVSRSDKKELYACGGYYYPNIKSIIEKVKKREGCKILFGHDDPMMKRNDWTFQSDQYNFHLKKIPFVYFGVEDHADYHRPTDDFNKIDPAFYSDSVENILRSIIAMDKELQ